AALAILAGLVTGSTSHAAAINFAVAVLDGSGLDYTGATLDKSTAFDFDGADLIVSSTGPGDASGLTPFPGMNDMVTLTPSNIVYGPGAGGGPLAMDVIKSWTGATGDTFTEKLTTVELINRSTANAITVTLIGTVSDSLGTFVNTPVSFIFSANQAGGPNTAIS